MGRFQKTDMLVAKVSGSVEHDGRTYWLKKGETRVRASHPLVRGREQMFELLTPTYEDEMTSSAPGQLRGRAA